MRCETKKVIIIKEFDNSNLVTGKAKQLYNGVRYGSKTLSNHLLRLLLSFFHNCHENTLVEIKGAYDYQSTIHKYHNRLILKACVIEIAIEFQNCNKEILNPYILLLYTMTQTNPASRLQAAIVLGK